MPQCVFPGCQNDANNTLGVRCRLPNTNAIFAPNTDVYLCDHHAYSGIRITMLLEATDTQSVDSTVIAVPPGVDRVTPIKQP